MALRFPRRTGTASNPAPDFLATLAARARGLLCALAVPAFMVCAAAFAATDAQTTGATKTGTQQTGASPQPSPTPYVRPRTVLKEREAERPETAPARVQGEEPAPTSGDDSPQEVGEDEVVRVDSNLVLIPASVLDSRGRAITDLRMEDFELRVDGEVQPISDLSRAETPVHITMLFDNSASLSAAREFEKQAAVRFFSSLVRPIDRAAIYSVSTTPTLSQPLTSDVGRLVNTIERFGKPDGATALFDALAQAAEYMRPVTGRKVIVVVSDGADTVSDVTFEEAVRLALRAECQVYVVQTRQVEEPSLRDPVAEERMQKISEQTGGAVFVPKLIEDLDTAFAQIALDLSQQYLLSYYPPRERKDNYFRFIAVSVKSRPNLRVRARKGFYPLAANAAAPTLPDGGATPAHNTRDPRDSRPQPRDKVRAEATRPTPLPDMPVRRVGPAGPDADETTGRPARAAELTSMTIRVADPTQVPAQVSSASSVQPASNTLFSTPQPAPAQPPTPEPTPTPQPTPQPASSPTPTPVAQPSAESKDATARAARDAAPAESRTISGGVLNSKALNLPRPSYPAAAKQGGVFGLVVVAVTVDERGRVTQAKAISGPMLLHTAAVTAARQARFSPTVLSGAPVKVTGTISYNFIRE